MGEFYAGEQEIVLHLLVDRVSTLMERLVPLNEVFLHNSQPFLNLVYVYPEKENV